jgi:hypothetical protein
VCANTAATIAPERKIRSEHRTLFLTDIEEYSAMHRHDAIRAHLRADLRRLVMTALKDSGIGRSQYRTQTTGDGLLVTVNAMVGKPRIVGGAMDRLAVGLRDYNRVIGVAERLRVRSVVHAGEVLIDGDGPLGHEVNFAFRLLDADELRVLLRETSGPLIVCVSDTVFRQVVAQRHEGLDPSPFEPVSLGAKGLVALGWVRAPGDSGVAIRAGLLASRA